MKIQRIEIQNYKVIKDLKKDLSGNVFIVKGDNEVGKSTFAKAFLKLMDKNTLEQTPVMHGEEEGKITGHFIDPELRKYTVTVEFTNNDATIKMVTPEGIISRKISDIKNLFNYNYIDVDQFLSWSSTSDGRKKQRNTILNVLPEQIREKFFELEQTEFSTYTERTEVNSTVKILESQINPPVDIDDEEGITAEYNKKKEKLLVFTEENTKIDTKLEILGSITERKDHIKEEIAKNEKVNSEKISTLQTSIQEFQNKIKRAEEKIDTVTKESLIEKKNLKEQLEELNVEDENPPVKHDITELTLEVNVLEKKLHDISLQASLREKYEKEKEQLTSVKKKAQELTETIEKTRKEKQSIINNSELSIPGLEIRDEGLYFKDLPFDKEQLSTSQILMIVFKLMVAINKKTPIFFFSRAESLGEANLNILTEYAESKNLQLFIDKVTPGPLGIEIVEQINK